MCPQRSNCPKHTEKRKRNNEIGTNKKTMQEMQKIRIQSVFLNGLSLYTVFCILN